MHFVIIDINGLVGQEFIGSEKSKDYLINLEILDNKTEKIFPESITSNNKKSTSWTYS